MLNIDFTNQLGATLTGVAPPVPRNQVVKFNNSWVCTGNTANIWHYLVVYRAMVHKGPGPAFAPAPPVRAGQAGTPWAAGWAGPVGDADIEAQVPNGRGGRYFDGVGVARIDVDINNLANPAVAFNVIFDRILMNSDGYEDPRIFRVGDRFFIHSHRYQPDDFRGAAAPEHRIYSGYSPERVPHVPTGPGTANQALFVKISELEVRNNRPFLGAEYFYGSNVSAHFEKNYGFFMDDDTLCALYGVAPNDRPMTMLRAVRGLSGQAMHQFPRSGRFLVEEFQPNTGANTENFLQLQNAYKAITPGRALTVFSSSGPLIWNAVLGRWQGVGHVKIMHARVFALIVQLAQAAHAIAQTPAFPSVVTGNANAAYAALMGNNAFVAAVGAYAAANPAAVLPFVTAYLGAAPSPEDHNKFIAALQNNLVRSNLFRFVFNAYSHANGHVTAVSGVPFANPWAHGNNIIFHWACFYLSFFFELDPVTYRLNRFSNAFLVYDPAHPRYLQFATNLAPAGADYLMSFGEDDNRAKVFHLTGANYAAAMVHNAGPGFNPVNYDFVTVNQAEVVI